MNQQGESKRADPDMYAKLRGNALKLRSSKLPESAVHVVLMDWHVTRGTVTVLAAVDGTASLYLSSGGGFLGGGQRHEQLNRQAKQAVALAQVILPQFQSASTYPLPAPGWVSFYAATSSGVYTAQALEDDLKSGTSPLNALGGIMQAIVSSYRTLPMDQQGAPYKGPVPN
jgi:hypothetical protein